MVVVVVVVIQPPPPPAMLDDDDVLPAAVTAAAGLVSSARKSCCSRTPIALLAIASLRRVSTSRPFSASQMCSHRSLAGPNCSGWYQPMVGSIKIGTVERGKPCGSPPCVRARERPCVCARGTCSTTYVCTLCWTLEMSVRGDTCVAWCVITPFRYPASVRACGRTGRRARTSVERASGRMHYIYTHTQHIHMHTRHVACHSPSRACRDNLATAS